MRFHCQRRHALLAQQASGGEQEGDGSADGTPADASAKGSDDWTTKQLGLLYGPLNALLLGIPMKFRPSKRPDGPPSRARGDDSALR